MVDPFQSTGLGPALERWGLGLGNDVIIDISPTGRRAGAGPEIPVVVRLRLPSDHARLPVRDVLPGGAHRLGQGQAARGRERAGARPDVRRELGGDEPGPDPDGPGQAGSRRGRGPLTIAAVATVDAKDAPADRKSAKARIVARRRLGLRGERVREPLRQPRLLPQHALVARRGGEPDRGAAQGVADAAGLPDRRPGPGRSSWCRWCSSR